MPFRATITIASPYLGGTGTNTWHARATNQGLDLQDDLENLAAIIQTFYAECASIFAPSTVFNFDGQWAGVGPDEGQYVPGDAWTETSFTGSTPLPPANALCVNWRGQSGDRSRRGRTFLGPLRVDTSDATGTPSTDALTVFRTQAAALVESSDTFGNGALGVWSRQESMFRDFVASSVRDQFAVLRSRRD